MFNRSEIMKAAWHKIRRFGTNRANALRLAWYEARQAAPVWSVWGQRIGGEKQLIAKGVTADRAGELKWFNECRYDIITITAA